MQVPFKDKINWKKWIEIYKMNGPTIEWMQYLTYFAAIKIPFCRIELKTNILLS